MIEKLNSLKGNKWNYNVGHIIARKGFEKTNKNI